MWFREGFGAEWKGGVVGNCARTSFLVSDPVLPDSGQA